MSEGQQHDSDRMTPLAGGQAVMSKNQLKKMAKRQRMLELRPEKRKLEKERRKRKRQELARLRDNNETSPAVMPPRITLMKDSDNKFRVIIDMDFGDLMTDDEIAKAAKQVNRIYSINRHSKRPCQLYITSLKGKIRDRFAVTCKGFDKWDANISEKDYVEALLPDTCDKTSLVKECDKIKQNLIYLTADAENDLSEVNEIVKNESKVFVIGGLVDHNRLKNLCYTRAHERGIKTARLPISQYVKLCQRHILSTVTVFEIIHNVLGHHEPWREAFLRAIPKRKIKPEELLVPKVELESTYASVVE